MPYQGEFASKASHFDIIRNPEVEQFRKDCNYLKIPSDEAGEAVGMRFIVPPAIQIISLPERVIAFDGSFYESSIDERLPSTKIGYVKISSVLIDMSLFKSLRVWNGRFVDPFRVAELQNDNSPLTFVLPSANIDWKSKGSVRNGFRAAIDYYLYNANTRFNKNDPKTSLRTTLFHLASRRPDVMGTGDPQRLKIYKCPSCGRDDSPIEVMDILDQQYCPYCNSEIYPSDCLRVWEDVSDHGSNVEAISRFMLQVEHLLPIHYIRYLVENSIATLGSIAFFIDGPMAVFGNGAWLHSSILRYLAEVNEQLSKIDQPRVLIIGLQKTGQVVDYLNLIGRFIPQNRVLAIDDEYRYNCILGGRERNKNGFGDESYYGQDFIYKTSSGRTFVFALPYPFASKRNPNRDFFIQAKTEFWRYPEFPNALALINHFESDLYENAIVPIALAHRYTAISLVPGGQILDLLTRKMFETKL